MLELKRHIGAVLTLQRERLGLTQAVLAKRMGKSQAYVARVEGGKRDPRWTTVLDFARALELEPMLIPRHRVAATEAIISSESDLPGGAPPFAGADW